ncbi:putative sister chromatid cohesion protein [Diaporthe ampelina]|uniref:Putative sister chromatid cohesion protein n=1 Tax=Diaporthe ampelina TaxID=1214573 RepID=A0A0G2FC35_9PEZI|nr:putative sister chromatid cohesion protein [Diaporthe ampelina]
MAASSVTLHPSTTSPPTTANSGNPLPQLLQTPSGLALLELQGTINLPAVEGGDGPQQQQPVDIGRLDFPDYRPDSLTFDASSTTWMRRVYMYVGQHQRLTGEVKKLPRAVGVVQRRQREQRGGCGGGDDRAEELEVVEIVKYKIVFSSRPEPVGTA